MALGMLLPRVRYGIGRAVTSGELWPRGELCPVCHVIEGAKRSTPTMKETDS
jgi:hypothetical protein